MFGIGYSKYAPGTIASFITSIIFVLLYQFQINIVILILAVSLIFFFSVYSIDKYGNYFIEVDAKEIVIDEFVGQSIPILTIYNLISKNDIGSFIFYVLISFIIFRFFDILKPYPANKVDKEMKNGFGVMFDDVIAGVYSSFVLLIIATYIMYE